ncbi:hypothetical protein [Spiroplasma endosymbiont of Colias croceus]|uniref:hypothetical protein n=1 Tax=Spiroplasma endosymbiont of Colias croceus TaxID=3066310 RepID=UPI0030CAAAA5
MTKEIEEKIIEFTNQISLKLNKNEQQVLNGIIKNYINISKHLIELNNQHNKKHK